MEVSWSRFYVPEIHDLHPGMAGRLDDLLAVLPERARECAAPLVVPAWQDRFPLEEDAAFVGRVKKLPGEKVLHGWTHSLGPDFVNWLIYGHDNRSEFARLSEADAAGRIAKGLRVFDACLGETPRWFCAPRWAQSRAATSALRKAGFFGYQLHNRCVVVDGPSVPLHAVCFDTGERKWKNGLARSARAGVIGRLLSAARPFRLTLHPADPEDPKTWGQVMDLMARLDDEGWKPVALGDVLPRWAEKAELL